MDKFYINVNMDFGMAIHVFELSVETKFEVCDISLSLSLSLCVCVHVYLCVYTNPFQGLVYQRIMPKAERLSEK